MFSGNQLSQSLSQPVVVVGGGAAGMAAALAAAPRAGSVCLVEAAPRVGGTVASALIHTLGGLYDSHGEPLNDGLPRELAGRLTSGGQAAWQRQMGKVYVLQVCPNHYRAVVEDWIAEHRNIHVLSGMRPTEAVRSGGRIVGLRLSGHGAAVQLTPAAVIDATGTAEVVSLIDDSLRWDDSRRAAGGWIFRVRGVAPDALKFPGGVAIVRQLHQAAAAGRLPAECGKAWVDVGIHDDEAFVKLFVPLRDGWRQRHGEISRQMRGIEAAVFAFLRRLPQFAHAEIAQSGQLGVRDGGRVRGEYCLTRTDVRQARKFDDGVCRCCWPIEYWDPEEGVSLEYLPPGEHYEIPMRSLRLPGLENVWVAGKCLSADRYAQASARVVGSCWAMGQAVGKAAAREGSGGRAQGSGFRITRGFAASPVKPEH